MRPGERFGERFEIERLAGSGGMGEVYRARDLRSGEAVAVKILRQGMAGEQRARFESEAQILAQVHNPAIVRYVDHGSTADGEHYLAMEWLEGEDLAARLCRAGLTVAEAVALGIRVAEALGHAHASGIVHRDLKPSNLFLPNRSLKAVKLIDFGVARLTHVPRMTQAGVIIGTPGYMAPEQVRGRQDIDARADVFALGCTLYECLTGEPAFTGEALRALLVKILVEDVPRVSELCAGVPPALDDLIDRMLAKDPDLRPLDGAAVAKVLATLELPLESARVASTRAGGPLSRAPFSWVGAPASRTPSSPPRRGLTQAEQQLLSVVLSAGDPPASLSVGQALGMEAAEKKQILRRTAEAHRAEIEVLTDGTVVAMLGGTGIATDQAAQAARCALALRAMLPNEPIALATGRGEVSGRLPVGEAIERAERMLRARKDAEKTGGPGSERRSIDIDEVTAGLLDAHFEVVGSDAGLELRAERDVTEGPRTLLGKPTACVGRERELASLTSIFAECTAEPVARAVVVLAPAGVGKSRLAHEFIEQQRRRGEPLELWIGRGDPMGAGSAFALVAQVIRRAAGLLDAEPLAARQKKLRARVTRHMDPAEGARVAEFLGELIGVPFPDEDRVELRAARQDPSIMDGWIRKAWEDFVQAECAALPVLLMIEDLHWGDLPSVKLIGYALRAARRQPLMVLALARPEVDELFVRLWADRGVQEIRLAELTPRASERLVRQALGSSASEGLIARLVEQADGHAFYLEELIRASAEGKSLDLPRTVVATVQTRLAALPPEMRRVLRAASIFGDVFWREGVAALLGNVRVTKVGDCLRELTERELLIRREASRFPGEDAYSFRHALLREGAYTMLTDQDLKLGHKLAGEWLERSAETDAMRLAEHFERGGEARRAVGYYRKAAEQALDGNDIGAVLSRAARGILCGASGEDKGALLLVQAEAHAWRGEYVDAEACALAALPNLTPMSPRWCGALTEASAAAQRRGAPDRILELSDLIGEHLDTGNATSTLVIAAARVVRDLYFTGLHENASALLRRIDPMLLEHSKSDPLAGAIRHLVHGQSAREAGDYAIAVQLYGAAAAEFDRMGDVREACRARVNLGFGYTELGAYEDAEQTLRQVLATTEPIGLFSMSATAKHFLGRVCGCLGRFDEARASLQAAVEVYAAGRQPQLEAATRIDFAMTLLRSGDPAAAEREALAAIGLLRLLPGARARGLATLAQVRLAMEHASDAISIAREATRFLGSKGHCEGDALIRLTLAECLRATGQLPAASAVISAARDRLFARAALIQDARLQDSFLSRVAENARTIELAEAWQQPSSDEKLERSSRPARAESESENDPLLHLREAEEALAEGDADAAIERARRRLILRAGGDGGASSSPEIEAWSAAAVLLRIVGRTDAADAAQAQLERLTQPRGTPDPSATAWRDLTRADRARQEAGEPWRALRLDETAFAGFTARGSPAALLARANIGLDYCQLGAHEEAEAVLREVLGATSRRRYTGTLASISLGATLAGRGAFDEARAPLESVAATERGRGNRYRAGLASSILAEVFLGLDDLKAAERQATSALELLSFAPLLYTLALSILALIQLRAGRPAEGLSNAREARAGREALGASGFRDAFVRLAHIEALIAKGDLARARIPLTRARHRIHATAAHIDDPALRRSFLGRVPENARTLDLARRWLGEEPETPR